MSSEDDFRKKRKGQRACDICRRRKTKCDGPRMPNNVCTSCLTNNTECTYVEASQKRAPPRAYVQALEDRVERMQALLQKLCPDGDFSQELGPAAPSPTADTPMSVFPKPPSPADTFLVSPSASNPIRPAAASRFFREGSGEQSSDEELPEVFRFSLQDQATDHALDPAAPRFIGKSSAARMIQNAIDMKSTLTGGSPGPHARRPEHWHTSSWETQRLTARPERRSYDFPPPDLLHALVDAYFVETNVMWPLLHRPTFERLVAEGLHLRDDGFAGVLLIVCGIASRYVDDPRTLVDGGLPLSAGWRYFNQVQMGQSLLVLPTLFDIQIYCLSVMFLCGSSAPQSCWSIVGVGIRLAQDVGAHRQKVYGNMPTVLSELWKRAFWVLVNFDRWWSSGLGRPCAIADEDFDLDMPTECDDEFWEASSTHKAFKQPPGRPSYMSYFVCNLKLQQIVSFALRTIYSINKSKVSLGFVGQEWEQNIMAELNSALNEWSESVPEHLRWNPEQPDDLFFRQAALLQCSYYQVQIMIHRPFIAYPDRPSPLSRSALAVCTNAARASARILAAHQRRCEIALPHQLGSAFTSAIVLLLKIWGGKPGGAGEDTLREMKDVYTCMDVLKRAESKWHIAGRLWDDLWELASVNNLPLPVAMAECARAEGRTPSELSATLTAWAGSSGFPPAHVQLGSDYGHARGVHGVGPAGDVSSSFVAGTSSSLATPAAGAYTFPELSFADLSAAMPANVPFSTPGEAGMSDGELSAWLNAPLGSLSEEWDSWVMGMSMSGQ